MYARVTQLEIDILRIDTDSAVQVYVSEVVPDLHRQPGYAGVLVLANPEGTGTIITFWDTLEAAEDSSPTGFYAEVIDKFATIFKSPPGRGRYEVRFAELPTTASP
ncbi:antibiotic biosynthesis monooxygenase family protein [Nocardioides sp. MAHUQ-72]|uniref:antibiotic biosynthesis monooxygenase family protein n=1 Tax=unclassified Nocardioides TaxID=2615069 RepID=UPI00361B358E